VRAAGRIKSNFRAARFGAQALNASTLAVSEAGRMPVLRQGVARGRIDRPNREGWFGIC
jgi:hypothetical protein